MEHTKKDFLAMYLLEQLRLGRSQRRYKTVLSERLKTRNDTIIEESYKNTIEQLRQEKNTLRAQIWTASGETFRRENIRYLHNIKCHVSCQEMLAEDIRQCKIDITNLEREISRVNKQVYDLNRKTVPDSQHQAFVAKTRKKMVLLENQLEVGVRRECGFTAMNAELREELIRMLNHRTGFNELYSKLVQKLNSDKKYLVDLIEYALGTFDQCIDVYEKLDLLTKRERKEAETRKVEMTAIMRKQASDAATLDFLDCKGRTRELDDLQPKEYRRRETFRRKHKKKLQLYNNILNKILDYTESKRVDEVIEKFQQQESTYYSYFNYANEMGYHMTLLNNAIDRLFQEINVLRVDNQNTLAEQLETIEKLRSTLKEKRQKNSELLTFRENNETRLQKLLQGIQLICEQSNTNTRPLKQLLGNYDEVNLVNMRNFLKVLEKRIFDCTAACYMAEREDRRLAQTNYVVKEVEKICEPPTGINDIVLTQQCPECAEVDAFNVDDAEGGVVVTPLDDVRKRLYDKVQQPEMQYRLHSISHCRLPRSRMLAARRNV